MQQGDNSHRTGRQAANLPKTETNIHKQQNKSDQNSHRTFQKEILAHCRIDRTGLHHLKMCIRILLIECWCNALLFLQGNRICPRKGDGYAVVRLCGIVYCGHIFMDTNRNVFSTGILHNVFHFSLLDTTRIGITDDCAASKLNIQTCAENEIKNNTNRYNSQRNPKEDLFSFAKFDMICSHFAAPPYNHLLRKHLNPETDFSIKREAPTPIMKLPMLPTSNV